MRRDVLDRRASLLVAPRLCEQRHHREAERTDACPSRAESLRSKGIRNPDSLCERSLETSQFRAARNPCRKRISRLRRDLESSQARSGLIQPANTKRSWGATMPCAALSCKEFDTECRKAERR